MTEKEYLFFDIECANCFGGEGKICSFGYVVCDEDFNITESEDLVMNPESRFDWALFSKKIDVSLSYPKQTFLSAPKFPHFYPKIKQLLTEHSGRIVGFAPKNDIGFLDYTCRRYGFELPRTKMADLVSILHTKINENMRLVQWAEKFNINMNRLTAHNSKDDAKMTMLVLAEFCRTYNMSVADAMKRASSEIIDTEKYLRQKKLSKQSKEYRIKIRQLYKATHIIKEDKLHGQRYYLMMPKHIDMKSQYEFALKICGVGGVLVPKIKNNVIVIAEDARVKEVASGELGRLCQSVIGINELKKQIL